MVTLAELANKLNEMGWTIVSFDGEHITMEPWDGYGRGSVTWHGNYRQFNPYETLANVAERHMDREYPGWRERKAAREHE